MATPNLTDKARGHYRALLKVLTDAAGEMTPDAFAAFLHHVTEDLDDVLFATVKRHNPMEQLQWVQEKHQL